LNDIILPIDRDYTKLMDSHNHCNKSDDLLFKINNSFPQEKGKDD